MMEIKTAKIEFIEVGNRLRSLDTDKVDALAESIAAIGLQQPISVYSPNDEVLDLVAGLHRLEACRKLGWEDIDCIFVNMDEIDRQLWEIDENLMRADLGPAELAQHLKRRAELWKEHKEKVGQVAPVSGGRGNKGFAKDTAEKTGVDKKTVNRAVSRANSIPADVLGKIEGTELDKGTYLDKLKKLSRDEQRDKVAGDLEEIGRRKNETREAREKRRNTKEQEEQAADRQRDLEMRIVQREAKEIAKFLRDRLSAEDFAKFRNAIADYSTYAAFLRVPVDGSMATIFTIDVGQSHSDNVPVYPPKPWESQS